MKKLSLIIFICIAFMIPAFSQANNTVDITDEVYTLLKNAEIRGLCDPLPNVKPYTEGFIVQTINTIIDNLESSNSKYKDNEIEQLEFYKARYTYNEGLDFNRLLFRAENEKGGVPLSFNLNLCEENYISSGFYSNSKVNSTGYEVWGSFNIFGDIGKNVSYKSNGYVELTSMPLEKLGTYDIGYWWEYYNNNTIRTINTYRNYSVMPFSYKKHWDGSVYYLHGGITAAGLEGWPTESSLAFGMQGEIHSSLYDGLIELSAGRLNREWGAMDDGASLVFNANAHPMFALEAEAKPFKWITISSLTGFLEFPNQSYILENAWYYTQDLAENSENGKWRDIDHPDARDIQVNDSFFFHNLFAIAMLDLDFTYIHWDFGSTVVLPNRFELGYAFPLMDKVIYQNNVGDVDNLALFTNLKLRYPGIGYIWGSFYLDEMNKPSAAIFKNSRCMFAYQGGVKSIIPGLPFTTISLRYTKVEPYCYTHNALGSTEKQPYYPNFISESYTNNGESLGYYLPPNADELFVKIETNPIKAARFSFGYQFIRHGVDWGSLSSMYSGSSIYSELITRIKTDKGKRTRAELRKQFLHDGTYEWYNIFNFTASYNLNAHNIPVQTYINLGYVHNWFTTIGTATQGTRNTPFTEIKNYKYYKISNDEYKENRGCVLSVGIKLFKL